MRFKIHRTSSGALPRGAYKVPVQGWREERRFAKTFEEFDAACAAQEGAWTSKGRNHKADWRGICREVEATYHADYIDIADLEALMALAKEHGELIVSCDPEPHLEISDDYRE